MSEVLRDSAVGATVTYASGLPILEMSLGRVFAFKERMRFTVRMNVHEYLQPDPVVESELAFHWWWAFPHPRARAPWRCTFRSRVGVQ
jgi:hypothetical protein